MKKDSKTSVKNGDHASVISDAKASTGHPTPRMNGEDATSTKRGSNRSVAQHPVQDERGSTAAASGAPLSLIITNTKVLLPDDDASGLPSTPTLTTEEQQDLERCEKVIEENKNAWLKTTAALHEIWSKRLYRAEYGSFKEYCEQRWKFSRTYGYRLVQAHKTIQKVSTVVDTPNPIINGSQALEIAKVPEENLVIVLKEAKEQAGDDEMTSRHIKDAVKVVCEARKEPTQAVPSEAELAAAEKVIALSKEWSGTYPTFSEMHAVAEEIRELAALPDRQHDIKPAITRLERWLLNYAQMERVKKAA